ncbi:AlpA family transcriptional regulator [Caballeronia sp. BR00000012568055]|uniref:helix-turn-helix transcriptional regulator n=1 Tax=Caballeronia sp. BR00000012568055 TaxID=2918761 RepID=UPI0023F6BAF3|nr:AlpA family phage regulatory protein [Caballeronia sp. BR00000012568055]
MQTTEKQLEQAVGKKVAVGTERKFTLEILRMREVMRITGMGRTTIYDAIARGAFPKSVKLTSKSIGFYAADIQTFLADPMGYRAPGAV